MKIYTKTGDQGQTGLFGGGRVSKTHPRVVAYGEVDELVSVLGLTRIHTEDEEFLAWLGEIQLELFLLSSELATPAEKKLKGEQIEEADVLRLEGLIDKCDEELPPLKSFVLPGGTKASGWLQLARTVCRRAERATVALAAEHPVRGELIRYLNRLSDLLFALARLANVRAGVEEVLIKDLRAARLARQESAATSESS